MALVVEAAPEGFISSAVIKEHRRKTAQEWINTWRDVCSKHRRKFKVSHPKARVIFFHFFAIGCSGLEGQKPFTKQGNTASEIEMQDNT